MHHRNTQHVYRRQALQFELKYTYELRERILIKEYLPDKESAFLTWLAYILLTKCKALVQCASKSLAVSVCVLPVGL